MPHTIKSYFGRRLLPFLDQALVSGTNFVTGIFLVRTLGLEAYGIYALLGSGAQFAAMIQQSAIIAPMMTYAPRLRPAERASYTSSILLIQIFFSFFSAVAVGAFVLIALHTSDNNHLHNTTIPLIAFIIISQINELYRRTYYSFGNFSTLLIADFIATMLQLLSVLALIFLDIVTISNALIATSVGGGIAAVFGFVHYGFKANLSDCIRIFRENWEMSKWLTPASFLQWASSNIVMLIASVQLGASAAGALRASQNIVAVLNVYFISLDNTLPVRSSVIFRDHGTRALMKYMRRATFYVLILTLCVTIPIAIFPSAIFHLFYGSTPDNYSDVLRGISLVYIFAGMSIPVRVVLRTIGHSRGLLKVSLLSTALSVSLAYPIITVTGQSGLVLSLILAQAVTLVGSYFVLLFALRGRQW